MPNRAFDLIKDDTALDLIDEYFSVAKNGRPAYSGSRFESFGGGGDVTDPHRITPADLTAVSMLSVHVPAQAAIGITGPLADRITELLIRLPVDRDLYDLDQSEFDAILNETSSPGTQLWNLLRQEKDRWGVGRTTASKIMARKRPRLVPVYDSVIDGALNLGSTSDEHWRTVYAALKDNRLLRERLEWLRRESGQSHLALLRVLDIVLWQNGRRPGDQTETVGDKDE